MAFLFTVLMLAIFVGVFASLMGEGLWTNAVSLFNAITAALLATNYFEPVADGLESAIPSGRLFWDIISLWVLFAIALGILRFVTDSVSKTRVRFKPPVDQAGGLFFAGWVAWVMLCFTMMTLHTAPLSRNFMFLAFRPEDRMMFGLAPDRQWLGFVNKMSRTSYSRMASETRPEAYVFDPHGEFMPKYASRRERYEKTNTLLGD